MTGNSRMRGYISKTVATAYSLTLFALLLMSLAGNSAELPQASSTPPAVGSDGFSYHTWRDAGSPDANEDWASGNFVFKPPVWELHSRRLMSAWREVGAEALVLTPLLREQLFAITNDGTSIVSVWRTHTDKALFSLTDKTVDALMGGFFDSGREFNWVKQLGGNFRAKVGKRPQSFNANGILALHESQDNVVVFQFQGSGDDKQSIGYTELFYRHALNDNNLLGINTLIDYQEDIERYGDGFWRLVYGGEWRSKWADIYGEQYLGLTKAKRYSDGSHIYTAAGGSAGMLLHAPSLPWLSAGLNYHRRKGQYGDADERILKYGVQINSGAGGWILKLNHDNTFDSKHSWSGFFTWTHRFSESGASASSVSNFNARRGFYQSTKSRYGQAIKQTTI